MRCPQRILRDPMARLRQPTLHRQTSAIQMWPRRSAALRFGDRKVFSSPTAECRQPTASYSACSSLTMLIVLPQPTPVLLACSKIHGKSEFLAITGVAQYSRNRRRFGTPDDNSPGNRARWCVDAKAVWRSHPHRYHRQRPSLSRRKLKTLAANSEGFSAQTSC